MITEEMIQQYEHDGAICCRQVIDAAAVRDLVRHIDALIEADENRWTTHRENGGFSDRHLWPTHIWMQRFCLESPAAQLAAKVMRSTSARLFFDHIFVRAAGTSQRTPWHQDRPYWPFQGNQIASVWIALSESDIDSSGLQFVRGSNTWGKVFRPTPFSAESPSAAFLEGADADAEVMPDFDAERTEYEFLCWDVQPGDAIVFGAEVVHGAAENKDVSQRRAALSIRYVGDDARWDPRPGTDPIVKAEDTAVMPGEPPLDEKIFPLAWQSDEPASGELT